MLKKNDIVDINIEDLSVGGAGIGKYEGLVVFVPKALPKETVSAKIIKVTKSYAAARLLSIDVNSPDRVNPFCEVFGKCGGCTLQHLSYEGQLAFKSRHIKECFRRLGGIDIQPPDILAAENIRDYRNKASFPVSAINGKAEAGFYAPRSHRLVVCDCPIQKRDINDIKNRIIGWANANGIKAYDEATGTGTLRHIIARQASNGDLMAGIVVREQIDDKPLADALIGVHGLKSIFVNINAKKTNAILGNSSHVVCGDEYITEMYEGLSFKVGFTSFLQINHEQSAKLYKIALDFADIAKDDVVFDLFCGIGTISLLAAKHAKAVVGIEYIKSAVDDAVRNAEINGIENAAFLAGDAGEKIAEAITLAGKPDVVILDPPRKGCDAVLIDKTAEISPKKVVYVSCDPATLARDVSLFCKQGYKLVNIQGVDMFTHTTHIECAALLEKI